MTHFQKSLDPLSKNTMKTAAREKFKEFDKMLKEDADLIFVADLWVLGDTIEEFTENVKRALESGKEIVCVNGEITICKKSQLMKE